MSRENVENVRRGIDAWNRDDLDGWLAGFAPEAELHTTGRFADERVYRGVRAGAVPGGNPRGRRGDRDFDLRLAGQRRRGAPGGDGQGRGKLSRAPVEQPIWVVTTLRDGLAVRVENYVDRAEALEAAGLTE
jgi:ketosteroid isomerase-like protein